MFLSTKKCEAIGECVKECPTGAIRIIEGKAFSCITCGICAENCPNKAIFKNKYGGYVVDRAKCNACGVCELACPINSIILEDGVVKGICSRCGVCVEACPIDARVDGYDVIEDRQLNFLESLKITIPPKLHIRKEKEEVKRGNIITDPEKCILCKRCEYYCPTDAIEVDIDLEDKCSECRICKDVCPTDAISDDIVVDEDKCTVCLKCVEECPNNAIYVDDFKIKIEKPKAEEEIKGTIVSCLNCGLCVEACGYEALKMVDGKIRYDPNLCDECETMDCLDVCPVGTLKISEDIKRRIKGFCVSCEKCIKICDLAEARSFEEVSWDGSVSPECISCGICAEVCPKDAVILKKQDIDVDLEKCILCEKCAIHCPVDAIPKTTMRKVSITDGFAFVEDKLCMRCKLCVKICPEEAISETEDGRLVVDDEKCIYCGACSNACPARAILFERGFEVSK